ncbi:RIP metalloprotease RseP [Nitratifractor sp.]
MSLVLYLLVALTALSVLVFFHELGHFTAARLFGVKIERFSIGFGRVLARRHCCGTEWAFSLIPLGGYVKMKGQDDSDPLARSADPDSYTAKKPWQRIVILLAGPLANLVLAFFIYLGIAAMGAPLIAASDYIPPVVGKVSPDSPAAKAGLKPGDRILAVGDHPIHYWYQIGQTIQETPDPILLRILRDGREMTLTLRTKVIDDRNIFKEKIQRRIIGIAPKVEKDMVIRFSPSEALFYAWNETKKASMLITKGIAKMSTGEVGTENVAGAITIFDLMMKFAQSGFVYLLFIMALISVNLGVLNLLPIPALDGGHIVFNLYEMITRRPPSEAVYYRLTVLGWVLLGGLMFLGLYNDINRIWGGNHVG